MFFVENGVFTFLGHKLDIQIMFVFFLDVFDCVRNVHGNSFELLPLRFCFQYNGKAAEKQAVVKLISNS